MTEAQKIEALIRRVERLEGAVFIRNDREHDCLAAAKHMRDKWNWKRDQITTARDFIRLAATRSSVTGSAYVIRFGDGREVGSAEFLHAELRRLERTEGSAQSPSP